MGQRVGVPSIEPPIAGFKGSFQKRRLNLAAFGGRCAAGVPHLSGGLRTPRVCSMLTRRWHPQTCFLTAAENYKTGQD